MREYCAIQWIVTGLMLISLSEARGAYVFTKIADTTTGAPSGLFTTFRSDPAISGGTVAFEGNFGGGGASRGIFTGNGGSITTIAKTGDVAPLGTFTDFGLRGATISGGMTVFYGRYTQGPSYYEGIFSGNGGPKTTIAKTGDAAPYGKFTIFSPASAVSGSTTAFVASYYKEGDTSSSTGVFNSTGGITTAMATANGEAPVRAFTSFGFPSISNGTTAFHGEFTGTGGFGRGIFIDSGGPTITSVKTGGPAPAGTFGGFSDPAISGTTTAFYANYNNCCQGVFTENGGVIVTIAKKGDAAASSTFSSFSTKPAISGGIVAFVGVNNSGSAGIYTGSGGPLASVIKGGDPLFGSTVLSLSLGTFGIDADGSGKIAFYYELSNGRRGIALASPSPVLPGDYDGNGTVNIQDYNVWKASFGSTANLSADGNGNQVIDAADYTVWRDHLGTSAGSGSGANAFASLSAIPEPRTWTLFVWAAFIAFPNVFRRRHLASIR